MGTVAAVTTASWHTSDFVENPPTDSSAEKPSVPALALTKPAPLTLPSLVVALGETLGFMWEESCFFPCFLYDCDFQFRFSKIQ